MSSSSSLCAEMGTARWRRRYQVGIEKSDLREQPVRAWHHMCFFWVSQGTSVSLQPPGLWLFLKKSAEIKACKEPLLGRAARGQPEASALG